MMVLCEPKHVEAAFIILTILILQRFHNSCALVGQKSVRLFYRHVQSPVYLLLFKLLFPTSKFHVLFRTLVTDPYTPFLIHVANPAQFGYSMAHLDIPNLFFRTPLDPVNYSALRYAPYFCLLQQSRFTYGLKYCVKSRASCSVQRLRWSRSSVLAFGTRVQTRPKPSDF